MTQDKKLICCCNGQLDHLYNTEDEDQLYEYYKCRNCGDIIRVNINK